MKKAAAILQHYGILPQAVVEVTSRVHRIKANGKEYALKRSRMTKNQLDMWLSVYELANKHNLYFILPLYVTRDQKLYVELDGEYYYLSPWIEDSHRKKRQEIQSALQMIGKIHLETKKIQQIEKDGIEKDFLNYENICHDYEKEFQTIIEGVERIRYPSPVELQLLTHYRTILDSLNKSRQLIERIISFAEDEAAWGTSLIHGSLEKTHLCEGYIINWEGASFNNACYDLSVFFQSESRRFGADKSLLQAFPAYIEQNPLGNFELAYLALYLLYPGNYLKWISSCLSSKDGNQSMVEQSIKTEYEYRKIAFGSIFFDQLQEFGLTSDLLGS